MKLVNELLSVQLLDIPYIDCYEHLKSGVSVCLPKENIGLVINKKAVSFDEFNIKQDFSDAAASYICTHKAQQYSLSIGFSLCDNHVDFRLEVLADELKILKNIDFYNMPFIDVHSHEASIYRDIDIQDTWEFNDRFKGGGRGLHWRQEQKGKISDITIDSGLRDCMHACVYDKICMFIKSDYPILPYVCKLSESEIFPKRSGSFQMALNTYQYRVRNKLSPPLEAKIVLLQDINGDDIADECDYLLYLNRSFPDPNPFYANRIAYKVFCCNEHGGVRTSLAGVEKIMEAIYNMTDGIPQIAYLCGWQLNGHDTLYPALNVTNAAIGTAEEYNLLAKKAKECYNTTLSYHINIDDSYPLSPQFCEDVLCKDIDGTYMKWIQTEERKDNPAYHICHTKDVESGDVFKRLDEFFNLLNIEKTVHTDAIRINNESWEDDGYIGIAEELRCGLEPIQEYFGKKDIDASAEGINGMPIDGPGYFSSFYHNSMGMLYHKKVIGGGYCDRSNWAWGNGAGIDSDIMYTAPEDGGIVNEWAQLSYTKNLKGIVDTVFCGAILYQFLLKHEMLITRESTTQDRNTHMKKRTITMSDGVIVEMVQETDELLITQGEQVIAKGYDRFVPLDNGIYCYSRLGFEGEYILPKEYRNCKLAIKTLAPENAPHMEFVNAGESISLHIAAGEALKLERADEEDKNA